MPVCWSVGHGGLRTVSASLARFKAKPVFNRYQRRRKKEEMNENKRLKNFRQLRARHLDHLIQVENPQHPLEGFFWIEKRSIEQVLDTRKFTLLGRLTNSLIPFFLTLLARDVRKNRSAFSTPCTHLLTVPEILTLSGLPTLKLV